MYFSDFVTSTDLLKIKHRTLFEVAYINGELLSEIEFLSRNPTKQNKTKTKKKPHNHFKVTLNSQYAKLPVKTGIIALNDKCFGCASQK